MPDGDAVSADGLSYCYAAGVPVLSNVSLNVPFGSWFGLLGPNGSGKSTLFRLLATLLPVQQGRLHVAGLDVAIQQSAVRQQIGVTFQSAALDSRLTVEENLWCQGRIYGAGGTPLKSRITELLQQFELEDRRRTPAADLSGGLRRRVELARSMLHAPRILLLDEPTSGLDPAARREFWALVRRQSGMTVIVSTHLMQEAEYCDQLALMDAGRVMAEGTPSDLRNLVPGERLTIRSDHPDAIIAALADVVSAVPQILGNEIVFHIPDPAACIPAILQRCGGRVTSVEISRASLEDVFLAKTGRHLHSPGVSE